MNPLFTLSANLLRTAAVLWIFFLANRLGAKLLSFLKNSEVENSFVIACALGLGLISYGVLALGFLGLLTRTFLILFLFVLTIPSLSGQRILHLPEFPIGRFYKALICALFLILFLRAFIPDQFYDVLQYHLALPQTYLFHKRIVVRPYNAYSGFPEVMEMLYTLGLGLGGNDTMPLMIQLGIGILIFVLLLNTFKNPHSGILAALLWLTCPLVLEHINFCKPDLFFSLCICSAFLTIENSSASYSAVLLSAVLTGLAVSIKYTGLAFAPVLAFFLVLRMKTIGLKPAAGSLLVFGGVILLLYAPWAVRNMLFFQNPVYPLLQGFFGVRHSLPGSMEYLSGALTGVKALESVFLHIYNLTFKGHGYPSMNYIGPVWLAFLPLLSTGSIREKKWMRFFVLILISYLFSAFLSPDWGRYFLLPVLPITSIAIVGCASEGDVLNKGLTILLMGGIFLNFFGWLSLFERVSYGRNAIFGMREEKISKLYPQGYFESAMWVNYSLPYDSRTLFLGETKTYLFRRETIAPSVNNEHPISEAIRSCGRGEDLYRKLTREYGVTHILLNRDELIRLRGYKMFAWKTGDLKILEEFWADHLLDERSFGPITIYKLCERSEVPAVFPDEMRRILEQ